MKSKDYLLLLSAENALARYLSDSFICDGCRVGWLVDDTNGNDLTDQVILPNERIFIEYLSTMPTIVSGLESMVFKPDFKIAIYCVSANNCIYEPLGDPQKVMVNVTDTLKQAMEFCRWACCQSDQRQGLRNVVFVSGDCDCCVCAILESAIQMLLRSSAQELAESQVVMNAIRVPRDLLSQQSVVDTDIIKDVAGVVEFFCSPASEYVSGNVISVPFGDNV